MLASLQSANSVTSRTRYEDLKRDILDAGRYSVFEITANRHAAALYAQFENDADVVIERIGYPWIRVRRRAAGEEVLIT